MRRYLIYSDLVISFCMEQLQLLRPVGRAENLRVNILALANRVCMLISKCRLANQRLLQAKAEKKFNIVKL